VVDVRSFGGFSSVEIVTQAELEAERAEDRREDLEDERED
jgi:hypothetical protein